MTVPQFHPLRIGEIRAETQDSISVRFDVPEALRETYRFRQGQFLTLRAEVGGESLRRSYSICCGVEDYGQHGELRVAIKRVAGGRFSNWANDSLRVGQTLDVMSPDGRFFTRLDPGERRRYLGMAGGSGITPMLSLVRTTLATEPLSRFTLIYGNRDTASIMFLEALEALKNRYLDRFQLIHVLADEASDLELFHGVLDEARCSALLAAVLPGPALDAAFICGPAPMMDAAEAALRSAGLAPERIHVERFGTPATPAAPVRILSDANAGTEVVVILNGKERRIRVGGEAAILDAGLAAGMDLPYACKGGVCCTCRARVLEGEVRMERNFALDADEVARGFVLTCQSHPVSERVVVSYDER